MFVPNHVAYLIVLLFLHVLLEYDGNKTDINTRDKKGRYCYTHDTRKLERLTLRSNYKRD